MCNHRYFKLITVAVAIPFASSAFALFTVTPWDMPSQINPHSGNTALMGQQEHIKQNIYQRGNMDLTDLVQGDRIVGVAFRLRNGEAGSWPPVGMTFNQYEMYLSSSTRPQFSYSNIFAENRGADFMQVRGGSLSVAAGSYVRVPLEILLVAACSSPLLDPPICLIKHTVIRVAICSSRSGTRGTEESTLLIIHSITFTTLKTSHSQEVVWEP